MTDGTAEGTTLLKDINEGSASSFPRSFTQLGDRLVFTAGDDTNGQELWVTDGTAEGTTLLKDINEGSASSSPFDFTQLGDRLVFTATDHTNGRELWVTDGTAEGTTLLKDINEASVLLDRFLATAREIPDGARVEITGSVALNDLLSGTPSDEIISGLGGDDTLWGFSGDDILAGGLGADTLIGGRGADIFVIDPEALTSAADDLIRDFSDGEGDRLDLGALLDGAFGEDSKDDFVRAETDGTDTTILVDADGAGGPAGFEEVATLEGVSIGNVTVIDEVTSVEIAIQSA